MHSGRCGKAARVAGRRPARCWRHRSRPGSDHRVRWGAHEPGHSMAKELKHVNTLSPRTLHDRLPQRPLPAPARGRPEALDPGDVLSVIDSTIAVESDPTKHPLYQLVAWHLEKCLTPLDGGAFFDTYRRLVLDPINVCLDEALSRGED
jgi:hypothetical protein